MDELIYDEELADQQRRALQRQTTLQQWAMEMEQQDLSKDQMSQPFGSEAGMPIEQAIQSVMGDETSQGVSAGVERQGSEDVSRPMQSNAFASSKGQEQPLQHRLANRRNELSHWLDTKLNSQPFAWSWLDQHAGQSDQGQIPSSRRINTSAQERFQPISTHIDRRLPPGQPWPRPPVGTGSPVVAGRGGPRGLIDYLPPDLRLDGRRPSPADLTSGPRRDHPRGLIDYYPAGQGPGGRRRSNATGPQGSGKTPPGSLIL